MPLSLYVNWSRQDVAPVIFESLFSNAHSYEYLWQVKLSTEILVSCENKCQWADNRQTTTKHNASTAIVGGSIILHSLLASHLGVYSLTCFFTIIYTTDIINLCKKNTTTLQYFVSHTTK